jgi:hypothetical protein
MKTSRYTNIAILAAGLAVGTVACNKQLDQVPQTDISDTGFWNSANDLANACNYLYSFLPGFGGSYTSIAPAATTAPTDNMSDDAYSNSGANQVSDGSRLAPATTADWNDNYRLIRAANNILEKSVKVVAAETEIKKYLGEARFFRAYAYFELVKRFGDVPLVMRTLGLNDEQLFSIRVDREIVLDSVYADLDYAVANLPAPGVQPAAEYGRITSTAALALKSRIGLFEGTRQKFHGYGSFQKHLQLSIEASDAVITGGKHQLFRYAANPDSSYYFLFQNAGEGAANKENILVRLYGQNEANSIAVHNWVRSTLEQGQTVPTRAIMDAYLYKDGLPADKSPLVQPMTETQAEFINRDPRLTMTVFNRNSWFITNNYTPTFAFSPTGYKTMKYFIAADWTPNRSYVDLMLIRYAEVLLNNAEAKFELSESISDADLNTTVNLVRARAGMPVLTNAFVADNGLIMRDEIRRERRIELAFEGHRYWDLIRWKQAEIELPKAVIGSKYFPAEHGNLNLNLDANGYVIVQDASKRQFNPSRDYLWPLPLQELGLNVNMTPNPNW